MTSDQDRPIDPPEGYFPYESSGPFTIANGPFYQRIDGEWVWRGFRAQKRHCNSFGIVHGGMLMSFADGLLAHAAWHGARITPLTIRMTSDFISAARPGDWVEGRARVTRATRSVVFVSGDVLIGDRPAMTLNALFAARARKPKGDAATDANAAATSGS
jgi:acyl-coenzyme A thioesterase PaaI-like protein